MSSASDKDKGDNKAKEDAQIAGVGVDAAATSPSNAAGTPSNVGTASNASIGESEKNLRDLQEAKKDASALLEDAYSNKYLVKNSAEDVRFKFEYKNNTMKINDGPFSFPTKK
ncbi:MAG: hypothetical protein HQK53_15730 [Oligoflexia bacterium]|nr:hypothetical protein [Oligoflexia bacterium]